MSSFSDIPKRNDTPRSLFNPLKTDFVAEIRDEHNVQQKYTIRSMEIETFPAWLASVILKRLIVSVQNERHINPIDPIAIEEIRKEIIVDEL